MGPEYASKVVPVLGYVAQLALPPKGFPTKELHAAHKMLSIPLSLNLLAVHSLEEFGGVKLVRASNYLKACMLRTAAKTVVGYEAMHEEMSTLAPDGCAPAHS